MVSHIIKIRQLKWFGHMIRLANNTPAKTALSYVLEKSKKLRGRQLTTWISTMTSQFKEMVLNWYQTTNISNNKKEWNKLIKKYFEQRNVNYFTNT